MFINLNLHEAREDSVYRYIHAWEAIPSSHRDGVYYLLLHVDVQWGQAKNRNEEVFTIAMQYSDTPGRNVAASQPAHILVSDVELVQARLAAFVMRAQSKK